MIRGFGPKSSALVAAHLAVAALAGCASGPLGGLAGASSLAAYQHKNAFVGSGYSETKIDDLRYQVKATGTDATPKERLEKIAITRAAEIGVAEKLAYFKVTGIAHGFSCSPKRDVYRTTVPASRYPTVTIDVVYAKTPPSGDPAYREAKGAFETGSAELAAETLAPEAAAANVADLKAKCGHES